jgi:hypothetical protein
MGGMLKLMLLPINVALYVPMRILNKIERYAEAAHRDANASIKLWFEAEGIPWNEEWD